MACSTMKILRNKHTPFIDIFTGEGWDNWSRYIKKKKDLIFIKGIKLTNAQFTILSTAIK